MISVSGLSKKFKDLVAVDNISFDVWEGEVFAFLGPNGAGKSTSIKMMTTISTPTSGSITLNGFNALTQKEQARSSFGIVFQDQSIDEELTALENMQFHAAIYGVTQKQAQKRISSLLDMVELSSRAGDFVKNFSGGMKRRLEIARGLIHHPKILFLDEPTLGLDPQTRNRMWEHIKRLNESENMTIFFTTHYMNEAEDMADTIAVIDYGRIVAKGSCDHITKSTGTSTLEEAFLDLTGRQIRQGNGSAMDRMRRFRRMR
ncbi:MAG: ATP-binding cassette domain-containing protein [Candidatus Altiarchaeales archaeon]|nr:ATP-binding cassette domain-containing protein [Candidatus Altiarchaeales archaeon]